MLIPPQPPRRAPRLLFPIGVVVGFALAMLVDAILHTALYQPPTGAAVAPLHEMTADAWSAPVTFPRDYFHAAEGP
jgi:hypothetical protein